MAIGIGADSLRALLSANLHGDTTYSDPTDLNTFLTLGQEKIVRDSPQTLGIKATTKATVASTQEYALASDFFQMKNMWIASLSRWLDPMSHKEWVAVVEAKGTITEGSPTHYIISSYDESNSVWQFRLHPTPDSILTVDYFYFWVPAAISGSGTDIPTIGKIGFSELLLWAATAIARERNDPEGAREAEARYQLLLPEYMSYEPQGPDHLRQLKDHMGALSGPGSTLTLPPEYPRV